METTAAKSIEEDIASKKRDIAIMDSLLQDCSTAGQARIYETRRREFVTELLELEQQQQQQQTAPASVSGVRVVKAGKLPLPKLFVGTRSYSCSYCDCTVECDKNSIQVDKATNKKGSSKWVVCPTSGCGSNIYVSDK